MLLSITYTKKHVALFFLFCSYKALNIVLLAVLRRHTQVVLKKLMTATNGDKWPRNGEECRASASTSFKANFFLLFNSKLVYVEICMYIPRRPDQPH